MNWKYLGDLSSEGQQDTFSKAKQKQKGRCFSDRPSFKVQFKHLLCDTGHVAWRLSFWILISKIGVKIYNTLANLFLWIK